MTADQRRQSMGLSELAALGGAWLRLAQGSGAVALAARMGYAARGAVYLSVGVMAFLAAVGRTPHAEGAVGALRAWGQWPIGVVLLWAAALGLVAFAVWRALQSVVDVEHLGISPKAICTRAGKAVSGLLYGTLGLTVLKLLDKLRDLHHADEQAETVASVQATLALPLGRAMVVSAGVALLLVGLGNMIRAFVDHFTGMLDCGVRWHGVIGGLARTGYFARGLAFVPAGVFTISAGWHAHASEAVSISKSLDLFKTLTFGRELLAVQAIGLAAFGVFGLVKALYRRVDG